MRWTVLAGLALAASLLGAVRSARADDVTPLYARLHEAIAYMHGREELDGVGIRVMRPNGTSVRRVVPDGFGVSSPAWSPDGRKLAYLTSQSRQGLYVLDLATGRSIRVDRGYSFLGSPAWSPDGRWIAATDGRRIVVVRPDGTGLRPVTQPGTSRADSGPTWSPDSRFLAFTRVVNPNSWPNNSADIYRVPLTGGAVMKLTEAPVNEYSPAWSPCGGEIAYVAETPGAPSTGDEEPRIWLMKEDGSERHIIVGSDPEDETFPAWSPDCQWIAFTRGWALATPTELEIYAVRPDGSQYRRITRNDRYDGHPAWVRRAAGVR